MFSVWMGLVPVENSTEPMVPGRTGPVGLRVQ